MDEAGARVHFFVEVGPAFDAGEGADGAEAEHRLLGDNGFHLVGGRIRVHLVDGLLQV
jgi:hypothetical protein